MNPLPTPSVQLIDPFDRPLFPELIRSTFLSRPNRFVIRCATAAGDLTAYLPNPGRLWELLLPGRIVYLVRKPTDGAGTLTHMAVAVEREGVPLLLHTHLNNAVAAFLLENRQIPDLRDVSIVRAEAKMGRSRFDFLLTRNGRPLYLEVKSCTLAGRRIAMFPDAVTARGKRHLEELASLSRRGTPCGVLFLVHWPETRFFLPDYHTDPAFSQTFAAVRKDLMIKAVSLSWRPDLTLARKVREVAIPWDTLEREGRDSGSYLLLLHLPRSVTVDVGSLGRIAFAAGFYLYVGSARVALAKRLQRHLRKNTVRRWHIDYLKVHSDRMTAIPIRSADPLEHEIAAAMGPIAEGVVPAFGSSDCDCPSHLFFFAEDPLGKQSFIDLLLHFRINRLEERIAAG